MLEIKNVPMHARSAAYFDGAGGTATISMGQFVKANGEASADLGGGGPGYAGNGDKLVTLATSGDVLSAAPVRVYPVKKYLFAVEGSDTDLDTIASGQGCVYFTEGEFETDVYGTVGSLNFGDKLYLDSVGKLTTGVHPDGMYPTAEVIAYQSTFDSDISATGLLHYRLLPQMLVTG